MNKTITILAIESSCDDTSAAVISNGFVLSNVLANQDVHVQYGGVVPELASRSHQQNIVPVVHEAIKRAQITIEDISAVAFTKGPGLLGSLLVGVSFAKGFALQRSIPLIDVNHLQAHVLAIFLQKKDENKSIPSFPFLCLLVSGGHTQLLLVRNFLEMELLGQTIDDAAGEAFDKCGKVIGLPYPAGPHIDRLAQEGDPERFPFSKPRIPNLDFSFSGLKTSFLYTIRDALKENELFIEQSKLDLCASLQKTIIDILIQKTEKAVKRTKVKELVIAGGVSANSGLRNAIIELGKKMKINTYLPSLVYTTDNAAMIGIAGYYKYLQNEFASHLVSPQSRISFE
ncbi:MAG: tRNA (adenosine(37)-N6)-threonylcarbamoyltransferase complex transferase subunit TsaD [Bacteroidales bacterium]